MERGRELEGVMGDKVTWWQGDGRDEHDQENTKG